MNLHIITANQAIAHNISPHELEDIAHWHEERIAKGRLTVQDYQHHKQVAKRLRDTASIVRTIKRKQKS